MIFVLPLRYWLVGATPAAVFQFIASGALGRRAFEDGTYSVLLGIGVHTLISIVSAAVFAIAALRWDWLRRHVILSGCACGIVAFLVMSFIVLPLSAIGLSLPRSPALFATSLCIHMFAFGVPIAVVCARLIERSDIGAGVKP
jgi:uncharacterized membrane protein YagU involved in acid resistance